MGGNKKQKRREDEQYRRAVEAQNKIYEKSPLEKKLEQRSLDILNFQESGKDIRDLGAMSPYIRMGEAALERGNRERMGTGALRLGDNGASGYTDQLKELRQKEMAQDYGVGLENAYAGVHAEALGSALPLAQLDQSRRNTGFSAASGMYGTILNRPQRQSWWERATGVVSGLAGGAGSMLGGIGSLRNGG